MKKVIFALVAVFVLGACLPISIPGLSTPTAEIQPTSDSATQTLPPPSTPTIAPVSNTDTSPSPTDVIVLAPSVTPAANLTTTPATSTDLPGNPTVTLTATTGSGQATSTPTLGILTYGTLPPEVPFNTITVWNRSKTQAYISLQVTLNDGRYAIIEYPVEGQIKIKAPLGTYIYVAWVGGNKLVGGFRNQSTDSLVIILFKDKVEIKQLTFTFPQVPL